MMPSLDLLTESLRHFRVSPLTEHSAEQAGNIFVEVDCVATNLVFHPFATMRLQLIELT
jgi:hypothetical protein